MRERRRDNVNKGLEGERGDKEERENKLRGETKRTRKEDSEGERRTGMRGMRAKPRARERRREMTRTHTLTNKEFEGESGRSHREREGRVLTTRAPARTPGS